MRAYFEFRLLHTLIAVGSSSGAKAPSFGASEEVATTAVDLPGIYCMGELSRIRNIAYSRLIGRNKAGRTVNIIPKTHDELTDRYEMSSVRNARAGSYRKKRPMNGFMGVLFKTWTKREADNASYRNVSRQIPRIYADIEEINLALDESAYTAFLIANDLNGLNLCMLCKVCRQ